MKAAHEGDCEEFLLIISNAHIIEKNISGAITEMLDLSALISVQPLTMVALNLSRIYNTHSHWWATIT